MQSPFAAAALALAFVLTPALGLAQAKPEKAPTAQQERMKSCNAEASKKGMKGDERQQFMSACLKGEEQLTAQQQKMKTCNKEASDKKLKGRERSSFMSECLKGSAKG